MYVGFKKFWLTQTIQLDIEDLEAQLNEIEHALDNLENQNDNIHSKLKELLDSNREIRKEMVDLGMIQSGTESAVSHSAGGGAPSLSSRTGTNLGSSQTVAGDVSQLQKINEFNMDSATTDDTIKSSPSKSKKNWEPVSLSLYLFSFCTKYFIPKS